MATESSRAVGLDIGSVRIGVAITDPGRMLATPRGFIPFAPPEQVLESLAMLLCEDWAEVGTIVVGLPIPLRDHSSKAVEQIRAWGEELERLAGKAVVFHDERFTTSEAQRLLRDAGKSARRNKKLVDGAAAALILQGWLSHPQ
jgi:putative holliday junction resolvase